jgi:putative oxidoreductase
MRALQNLTALVGRIALVVIFAASGWGKFMDPEGTVGFMTKVGHVPAGFATPLLYLSAVIELGGAILIIIGFKSRYIAALLFLFLIPVTYLFHASQGDSIQTLKNISMMGGFLLLVAHGPGDFAID